MQDDVIERGAELRDAVLRSCGGEHPVELADDPCGPGLGGDPHGLPADTGSQGHIACARMGTCCAGEVDTAIPAI